jgi:hypothetical protein
MITRETIAQIPEVSHVLPPSIISLPSGRHAVYPGGSWYPISDDVTLEDVQSRWSKWQPEQNKKQQTDQNQWHISGSKGNTYTVMLEAGRWSCTCAGFGFRRKCRHVEEIKSKGGA